MKTRITKRITTNFLIGFAAVILLFAGSSCSHKASFVTSSVVPDAQGSVKIKKDKNHNFVILIQLSSLVDPKTLQPPKKTYVVWMVTNNDVPQNIGQINTSKTLLSKNLRSSFVTTSPTRPTKIFITAEDDAKTLSPDSREVLSTRTFL